MTGHFSNEPSERQKEILEYLRSYVREQGFPPSMREIGARFCLKSTNAVARNLDALARLGYIERLPGARSLRILLPDCAEPEDAPPSLPDNMQMIPLVGTVAAGTPITAIQDIEDHIPICSDWFPADERSFFLRVRGESMATGIMPGDLVLVHPNERPVRADIVVAMLDDEATVKRFYPESDRVILRADNPAFPDIVARRDLTIVGKVGGLIRRYR